MYVIPLSRPNKKSIAFLRFYVEYLILPVLVLVNDFCTSRLQIKLFMEML